jgi:arylformamidase
VSTVFLGYDREALDALYDTRRMVPDHPDHLRRFEAASERARREHPSRLDLRYGAHERERLDVFLPPGDGPFPANLFFHGGYWRSSTKERYSYVAEGLVPAGAAAVVVEYALVPDVDLDTLVAQCRGALAWVHGNAADLRIDPDRLFVSGHSAGGHLVAMLMAAGWARAAGLPADVVKGGLSISGLFDLEPIRLSYLNETLGLDRAAAERNSPYLLAPAGDAPIVLAVGGEEGPEFIRQSELLDSCWRSQGVPTELRVDAGQNHYDMVEALGDPAASLSRAVHRQMGLVQR